MVLEVRIGLDAREQVAQEGDFLRTSVQLAKHICDHAEPGQIVLPGVARQVPTGKGILFSDPGDLVPDGFEQPARLYEVRWRDRVSRQPAALRRET